MGLVAAMKCYRLNKADVAITDYRVLAFENKQSLGKLGGSEFLSLGGSDAISALHLSGTARFCAVAGKPTVISRLEMLTSFLPHRIQYTPAPCSSDILTRRVQGAQVSSIAAYSPNHTHNP